MVLGDREGVAAAARRGGVRVTDLERGAHQILDEIDLGAIQQIERNVVDDDGDPVALEHPIVGVRLVIEAQSVLEARAAAARDRDAQIGGADLLLFAQKDYAFRGAFGHRDAAFTRRAQRLAHRLRLHLAHRGAAVYLVNHGRSYHLADAKSRDGSSRSAGTAAGAGKKGAVAV